MVSRGLQDDQGGEWDPFRKKLERGVAPIDMGSMDLGHGDMGQPGGPDSETWVGRDVQSIIIIWRLIWCAGIHFLLWYLLPVAKSTQAQVPSIPASPATRLQSTARSTACTSRLGHVEENRLSEI